jgi:hypothetical protein
MGSAAKKTGRAVFGWEVLIVSSWSFGITPLGEVGTMLVSEVVGEAIWRRHPKPKQLPIPGPSKAKSRVKPKSRPKPRPFSEPKPEELS